MTRRKPIAEHILNGNPSKKTKAELERAGQDPVPLTVLPRAPVWLGQHGKAEWRRTGKELVDQGKLTAQDLPAFAAYCQNVHVMVISSESIQNDGLVVMGSRGPVRNPALAAFSNATSAVRAFAIAFGATPASRATQPDEDDGPTLADILGDTSDDDVS